MEHTLRSVLAIVHDQPVPLLESLLLRDGPGCEHQVTQQARVLVFGCTDTLQPEPHALSASGRATAGPGQRAERREAAAATHGDGLLRDDKDVDGRLRVHVCKRQRSLILEHDVGRNFFADDLAENAESAARHHARP
jgi:hypothetical protein